MIKHAVNKTISCFLYDYNLYNFICFPSVGTNFFSFVLCILCLCVHISCRFILLRLDMFFHINIIIVGNSIPLEYYIFWFNDLLNVWLLSNIIKLYRTLFLWQLAAHFMTFYTSVRAMKYASDIISEASTSSVYIVYP